MEFFDIFKQRDITHLVSLLKRIGYTNVTNIGGIFSYSGKVER